MQFNRKVCSCMRIMFSDTFLIFVYFLWPMAFSYCARTSFLKRNGLWPINPHWNISQFQGSRIIFVLSPESGTFPTDCPTFLLVSILQAVCPALDGCALIYAFCVSKANLQVWQFLQVSTETFMLFTFHQFLKVLGAGHWETFQTSNLSTSPQCNNFSPLSSGYDFKLHQN